MVTQHLNVCCQMNYRASKLCHIHYTIHIMQCVMYIKVRTLYMIDYIYIGYRSTILLYLKLMQYTAVLGIHTNPFLAQRISCKFGASLLGDYNSDVLCCTCFTSRVSLHVFNCTYFTSRTLLHVFFFTYFTAHVLLRVFYATCF